MDGICVQEYFSSEVKAMLETYKQFQTLLPHETQDAASNKAEDGRYIESLIKECLKKFLPKDLEILSGFILRPATKTGIDNRSRKSERDLHSTQLDIIVYDSCHYPVFQRFGDNAVVPPEGVVGIISVKKKLNDSDFKKECKALQKAAKLCRNAERAKNKMRGPFLALVGMDSIDKKLTPTQEWVFKEMFEAYGGKVATFEEAIGLITSFKEWSIFKKRPSPKSNPSKASYICYEHGEGEEHLGLQLLLTGILSVYYDPSRNYRKRPGFTAFPPNRDIKCLGEIAISPERKDRAAGKE